MDVEKESSSGGLSDAGAWALNVISSVGVIMANKKLMSSHGGYAFTYGLSSVILLTFLFITFVIYILVIVRCKLI